MRSVTFIVIGLLGALCVGVAGAQATPAAKQPIDLQAGVGYSNGDPDYSPHRDSGFTVYGDADLRHHIGVEVDFHKLTSDDPQSIYRISERSFEVGGRYYWNIQRRFRFRPYGKVLYGRGTFGTNSGSNGYNMIVGGGGLDFQVQRQINVRADFEFQRWLSFSPNDLSPNILTIGVAYHFPVGWSRY